MVSDHHLEPACDFAHIMKTTIFRWLTIILEFLNLPWEDAVMHHEEQINKPGGVSFSISFTIL